MIIMEIRCMAYIGLILVSLAATIQAQPDQEFSPVAEPLKMTCLSKNDCPLGSFCEGRGQVKRCTVCINCSNYKKKPKPRSYDGESCATHHSECGECFPGYEEGGGVCMPKVTSTSSPIRTHAEDGNVEEFNYQENDVKTANIQNLVIGIGGTILLAGFFLGVGVGIRKTVANYKKRGHGRVEEEAGLTTYNNDHTSPTAPFPDEYGKQSPINKQAYFSSNSLTRLVNDQTAGALPFQRGNGWGYGNVAGQSGDLPDATDGANASAQSQQQGIAGAGTNRNGGVPDEANNNVARQSDGHVPPTHGPGEGQMGRRNPNSTGSNNMMMVSSRGTVDGSGSFGGQQPSQSASGHDRQQADPVLANVQMFAYFNVSVPIHNSQQQAQNPNVDPGRNVASAPPSPGFIDQSYYSFRQQGLYQHNQSFRRSQASSMDSGTGTNNRSVPSASGSGENFSELDDSGDLYDDDHTGSTVVASQDAVVPAPVVPANPQPANNVNNDWYNRVAVGIVEMELMDIEPEE